MLWSMTGLACLAAGDFTSRRRFHFQDANSSGELQESMTMFMELSGSYSKDFLFLFLLISLTRGFILRNSSVRFCNCQVPCSN